MRPYNKLEIKPVAKSIAVFIPADGEPMQAATGREFLKDVGIVDPAEKFTWRPEDRDTDG